MPYVDFVAKDDRVSLWYITNTPGGNVGAFDPDKPTIVMLHPMFLDSNWMQTQMEDPRLDGRYNIIAFDMRSCGKSTSKPSGAHDTWVDSADLAFAHSALGLPPVHIFAVENLSVNSALRFAALFPDLCLSLTLVNVPPPTELEWVFETYGELLNMWCYPQDLDELEHACLELSQFMLGKDCATDLQDELIAYWCLLYPPWRRTRIYETMHCVLNRTPLPRDVVAAITQPTLIIQADKTDINPIKYAEKLAEDLVNVPGGARVHTVRGSPEYVTIVPTCASIVNRVFAEFLSRQPQVPSPLVIPHPTTLRERMVAALARLAEFTAEPTVAERNPYSPLSFSCVTPEVLQSQSEAILRHQKDEDHALSPLGFDGRPLRLYSERQDDHWFRAEKEAPEIAPSSFVYKKEEKLKALEYLVLQTEYLSTKENLAADHLAPTVPVSSEVARSGRIRRSNVAKHVVEKATIGGASSNFAPTIISSTLQMRRLRL